MRLMIRSLLALPLVAGVALAQGATPAAAPVATTWRTEYLAVMQGTADKYIQLAEAMPADKFTWRPAPGVRSVAETFLHVATANYGLAPRLGGQLPAGVNVGALERSTTDKAEIVRHLRAAFAHFKATVEAFPDAGADRMVPFFGPPQVTARHFLYFNADHNGEHLGQLIAYARMNGVTPPWSGGGN